MWLWIAATTVGQASQRTVLVMRMVETFSSSYPTKCTYSSLLENSYSIGLFFLCWGNKKNCKQMRKRKQRQKTKQN
ncbi:hypothetical protein ERO13_D04G104012v2 [Gossypium hirsutum]|nr:hypothetical protein ERO13_D04G104012v2 [Gossypium hirsutum]